MNMPYSGRWIYALCCFHSTLINLLKIDSVKLNQAKKTSTRNALCTAIARELSIDLYIHSFHSGTIHDFVIEGIPCQIIQTVKPRCQGLASRLRHSKVRTNEINQISKFRVFSVQTIGNVTS